MKILKTQYSDIQTLRKQYLTEMNCQIRYDSCHFRGWTDEYTLWIHNQKVGYGSVKGYDDLHDRDTIFEFYVLPSFRKQAFQLFQELINATKVTHLECQTNDEFLTNLVYEFGQNIYAHTILFEDGQPTYFHRPELKLRKRQPSDQVFDKSTEEAGDYVLLQNDKMVADGGFLTHYNPPFADLYMETKPELWNQGLGSYILQELKKECYLVGRVPAARCHINNTASKATLLKAGFRVCGYILMAEVSEE